jgi:hypothetical protein
MDPITVAGIVIDPVIAVAVAGAVGGLTRFVVWRSENPSEIKTNYWKVGRNLLLGAIGGIGIDTSIAAAYGVGLALEYVAQNAGSRVSDKVEPPVTKVVEQVKSLLS